MFDYTGNNCPYCQKRFTQGDDIAVCPDCGTPHHRACYLEHGACANATKHAQGYDWQAAHVEAKSATPAQTVCPSCGHVVSADSTFCNYCGNQLAQHQQQRLAHTPDAPGERPPFAPFMMQQDDEIASPQDYLARMVKSKEFDGIPITDWLKYIGNRSAYYLTFFQLQDDTGRKTFFTASAMLFPVLYFLYRKLWVPAMLAFFASLVFGIPSILLGFSELGFITGLNTAFWMSIQNITYVMGLAVNFMWGLYAVRLYRKTSAKRIHSLKVKSATEQEYQGMLERVSGPSMLAVLVPFCIVAILMMLSMFIY